MIKVAIMYDFDLTLCTKNMQEYSLLPTLDIKPELFWQEVEDYSIKVNMDSILAYMYLLIQKAKEKNIPLTRKFLNSLGNDIVYYPGVEDFFKRINKFALEHDILLQHYIISSGTKEIIEGCSIKDNFTKIYACEYHYNENGQADFPAVAINYTGKTQFLFRINKNSLDVFDNSTINSFSPTRDIPFEQMIYIGDGFTDVPCMRLVKSNGGYSIAIHNKGKETYKKLLEDGRVNYISVADYRENSEIDNIIKLILKKIAIKQELNKYSK
ncbi:MAG: haloacid dehalogenase-like hydrolase [Erysipelotrichia bacterium]|nr:haloacid dehalogenase-like hydrolase [Erysipelotrichia bacterium]